MKKFHLLIILQIVTFSCTHSKNTDKDEFIKVLGEIKLVKKVIKPYEEHISTEYIYEDSDNTSKRYDPVIVNQWVSNLGQEMRSIRKQAGDGLDSALKGLVARRPVALAYYLIANLEGDRPELAATMINKAIALDNKLGEYYSLRAQIYELQNKYAFALKDYHIALKLYSDKFSIYSRVLHLYRLSKNERQMFATHRTIIKYLTDSIYYDKLNVLRQNVLKHNLSLEYVAQAYDFMAYNKPDSVKLAIKKAIELGYQITPQESSDFAELTKAL